jgi:hypothetical protein
MANIGLPGVMKSNGKAITATNIGIKEVRIMNDFKGILDEIESKKVIAIRIIKGKILLAIIATSMRAVDDRIFTLGSMF